MLACGYLALGRELVVDALDVGLRVQVRLGNPTVDTHVDASHYERRDSIDTRVCTTSRSIVLERTSCTWSARAVARAWRVDRASHAPRRWQTCRQLASSWLFASHAYPYCQSG